MPKYVGVNINEFNQFTKNDMLRAIKKDPTVIFIKGAKMMQSEFDSISIAYQSGHEVRLIHNDSDVQDVEWVLPLPSRG
jgi:hypothetical protein